MMRKKARVALLGDGRIGQAVRYYCQRSGFVKTAEFLRKDKDLGSFDLLIGALPGGIGERCLQLALAYKKNLIDISDVDPPAYLKQRKEIEKRGIVVIPGCGFSPGLVNFLLGYEFSSGKRISKVEIRAGSLSPRESFYPFLWCFEDIIVEHTIPSWQLIAGEKKKFRPFDGYRKEIFRGIPAENYYCPSGFENLLKKFHVQDFICRVVRPRGFQTFFSFLKNQGCFKKDALPMAKRLLESVKEDNITLGEIFFSAGNKTVLWSMYASSRAGEKLNSMQKITAAVPAAVAQFLLEGKIKEKGLIFMDELAEDHGVAGALLAEIRKRGIRVERK